MSDESNLPIVLLAPGQGAPARVGMGKAWAASSDAARAVFDEADAILGDQLGAPLSQLCFEGPAEVLNRTDVSQPAIYTCSVACARALMAGDLAGRTIAETAGLSLGEYTALHMSGVFDFEAGLRLVARRGRLMQDAAEASDGGMVALIGADEEAATSVCEKAREGGVLVCANFNAPGQIVLSGSSGACDRAVEAAGTAGLRATRLTVAGAFHSPLMQPAADGMGAELAAVDLRPASIPVWSNVTAGRHDPENMELLRERLVQQIVSPVRWAESCHSLAQGDTMHWHELAPGSVLRGLMRRIVRTVKVTSHDEP